MRGIDLEMKRALRIAVTFVDGDPHIVIAHEIGTGTIDDNLVIDSNTEIPRRSKAA